MSKQQHSCGKTTLSRLLARQANCFFKELSATSSGINDVRNVFEEAKGSLALTGRYVGGLYHEVPSTPCILGRKTILFLDEIHRFNKSQQVCSSYLRHALISMDTRISSYRTLRKARYRSITSWRTTTLRDTYPHTSR